MLCSQQIDLRGARLAVDRLDHPSMQATTLAQSNENIVVAALRNHRQRVVIPGQRAYGHPGASARGIRERRLNRSLPSGEDAVFAEQHRPDPKSTGGLGSPVAVAPVTLVTARIHADVRRWRTIRQQDLPAD